MIRVSKEWGLDYVDIFYHHRPDPDTPLEETAEALMQLVRQGKALYIGISNYNGEDTKKMTEILKEKKHRSLFIRCATICFLVNY